MMPFSVLSWLNGEKYQPSFLQWLFNVCFVHHWRESFQKNNVRLHSLSGEGSLFSRHETSRNQPFRARTDCLKVIPRTQNFQTNDLKKEIEDECWREKVTEWDKHFEVQCSNVRFSCAIS